MCVHGTGTGSRVKSINNIIDTSVHIFDDSLNFLWGDIAKRKLLTGRFGAMVSINLQVEFLCNLVDRKSSRAPKRSEVFVETVC